MAIVTSSTSSSSTHLIHNLLRLPKPPSPVYLFLRPFCVSSVSQSNLRNKPRSHLQSFSSSPLRSSFTSLVAKSFSSTSGTDIDEDEDNEDEDDYSAEEYEHEEGEEEDELVSEVVSVRNSEASEEISEMGLVEKEEKPEITKKKKSQGSALKLSIKEKKELASYAHSLGDKLKCQLVGKSGVTDSVIFSFLETLEKNELLKVKIRKTSPEELEDAVQRLEEATGSVAVGQIGRTVILYRPSPTKMKAEEKKKEVERMSSIRRRKYTNSRPTRPFRREYSERPDGRGRRGGSRVATS